MSNYAILRVGKLKSAGAVRGMLNHNFRTIDTPNANAELIAENEHLEASSVNEGMKMYRDLLPEKVRKNAVHAIDYMITTSPDASIQAKEKAMSEAYKWVCDKHGKKNVIMASKHRDETTPHIHLLVMPLDEKGKLNARKYIGGSKHRMTDLQTEFYEHLKSKKIDLRRGLKGSKARHQKVSEWHKKNKAVEEITYQTLRNKIDQSLVRQKKSFLKKETDLEAAERTIKSLQSLVVDQIRSKSDLSQKLFDQKNTSQNLSADATAYRALRREVDRGKTEKIDELAKKANDRKQGSRYKTRSKGSVSR